MPLAKPTCVVASLALLFAATGCSTLPKQNDTPPPRAALDTSATRLGLAAAPELAAHPGMSGYHPMNLGTDAFVARMLLARAAERTLDVQYYDFHADQTGAAFIHELLAAADRGVHVRLLLDDLHTSGRDDVLAAVDAHPNVEVRLFNPFVHRGARWLDFLTDFSRVNRRMHNKSMTADNQMTVVGGRNIGDQYFAAPTEVEFSDFDVVAIGPVVSQVSAEFDNFWFSALTYTPASLKLGGKLSKDALAQARQKLEKNIDSLKMTPYAKDLPSNDLARSLQLHEVSLYWGGGAVIADEPRKVTLPPSDSTTHAMPKVEKILEQAQHELILVSPYFIPRKDGLKWLQGIASRGVKVKILTNSTAANDVKIVSSTYALYREELLRSGIEIYELKHTLAVHGGAGRQEKLPKASRSSLHAKIYIADTGTLFVGSMNLDPRSVDLNTEMGIMISSETLGVAVRDGLVARLPEIAYRVELDTSKDPKGRLVWITQENGSEVRLDSEPAVGFFGSVSRGLQQALPIEGLL
ncbi:MAG TPA: phospholipase D family protein [Steroidobacteraceae bacterium]